MSDQRFTNQAREGDTKRPEPQRPPIQWPQRQASTQDNERATHYARQQLGRVFQEVDKTPNHTVSQDTSYTEQSDNHTEIQSVNQQTDNEYDWGTYHQAWQSYYQQYFHRYYAGMWQQRQPRQSQLATERTHTKDEAIMGSNETEAEKSEKLKVAEELRDKIRNKVQTRAKKVKSSSHFKPLIAAFSVASIFLFINYNQVIVGAVKQYITPGGIVTDPVIVESDATVQVGPEPKLIIPKIGLEAPVVYDEPRVDEASYQKALDKGVVRLGNTPDPGTKGNTVIGGHSSNNVFNTGGWKYVFVNLKRLDKGDVFYLNFEGKRYTYRITTKKIVKPTDVSVLAQTEKPIVTLFTCDPPGTNVNRLIIQAEQIDPDPDAAAKAETKESNIDTENPMPAVAPSIWSRIF